MGCSTVNCKETPNDEILRRIAELEKKDKEKGDALFYHTDTITSILTKLDVLTGKLTWNDNEINIQKKRLSHHINTPKWHFKGQPVIK